MVGLTSAGGVVGFLSEPDHELQIFALRKLNEEIDSVWTEVVGSIGDVEALYEDSQFPERELAALVVSKVYYNLQEYNESMIFALGAGKLFNIDSQGEYEDTIISRCVDTYIAFSSQSSPSDSSQTPSQLNSAFPAGTDGAASTSAGLSSPTMPFSQAILPSKSLLSRQDSTSTLPTADANTTLPSGPAPISSAQVGSIQAPLQKVIDQLFERCFREKRYRQVVGIAVEARQFKVIRQAIIRANDDEKNAGKAKKEGAGQAEELLEYLLSICMDVVQERTLRQEVSAIDMSTTKLNDG